MPTVNYNYAPLDTVWRVEEDVAEATVLEVNLAVSSTGTTIEYKIKYEHTGLLDEVAESMLYPDVDSALTAYKTALTAP